jgi:glycosyltransferase 2 family protein
MMMTTSDPTPNRWQKFQNLLKNRNIQRLMYALIVLASGVFIAYAVYSNWNEFKSQQWDFNYSYILLAVLLYPAGMLPTVAAWHKLLQAMGVNCSFQTDLRLYSLSTLPKHIPGFVMFVTSRSLLYQEEKVSAATSVTATGAETVLLALTGFISSILLFFLGSERIGQFNAFRFIAPVAIALLIVFIFWTPALNRMLQKILARRGIQQVPQLDQRQTVFSLLWMFAAWIGGGLILFVLVQAVNPMSLSFLPVMIGTWGAAGAVSLTIGIGIQGLGIREITLGALLSLVMPTLTAIVIAVAFRLVLTIGEILWVVFFIWITKKPSRNLEGVSNE